MWGWGGGQGQGGGLGGRAGRGDVEEGVRAQGFTAGTTGRVFQYALLDAPKATAK